MSFFRMLRYVVGALCFGYALFQMKTADALGPKKPSIMSGSADVTQADSAINEIVEFILYFVYAGGVIALVVSLAMCLPFIGRTEKGTNGIKVSVLVICAAGLVHLFYAFLGGLFT